MADRKKKTAAAVVREDPWPYLGSLRRIDGVAPYNHYLWAMDGDWYWANRHLDRRYSSRFNFYVVALADGRWLSCGLICLDETDMRFFCDRQSALRHSAARLLRTIRSARKWTGFDHVSPADYIALTAWIFQIIGRKPVALTIKPAPPPPPAWSDLPLFEETIHG